MPRFKLTIEYAGTRYSGWQIQKNAKTVQGEIDAAVRAVTRRTEDNFAALLELAGSDTLVAVNGSRATAGRSGLIDLAGAEGQLVGDHYLGFAYRVRGTERTPLVLPAPVPTVREALRAFARLIRDGTPPVATVEDGARAVLVAEACYRAAASGAAVAVPDLLAPG